MSGRELIWLISARRCGSDADCVVFLTLQSNQNPSIEAIEFKRYFRVWATLVRVGSNEETP
jgi:hypothetical protein